MSNIIKLSLLVVLALLMGAFGYWVFDEWMEPSAEYLATKDIKVQNVRMEVRELVEELEGEGLYKCCIRNDCAWCAIYLGYCPCESLVARRGKEESCPECAAAWNEKRGTVPGVDPDAIKVTTFGIYKNK
jgi:hypothetical protein